MKHLIATVVAALAASGCSANTDSKLVTGSVRASVTAALSTQTTSTTSGSTHSQTTATEASTSRSETTTSQTTDSTPSTSQATTTTSSQTRSSTQKSSTSSTSRASTAADADVVGPYVAVARYVLLIDNTFGGGGVNPFKRVELGLDLTTGPRPDPGAKVGATGHPAAAREAATLAQVVDTLAHGTDGSPPLPVVAAAPGAPNEVTSGQMSPTASLRLSSVAFDSGGATARVSVAMMCGDLCGWWTQYVIDRGPSGWNVRGREGPALIS